MTTGQASTYLVTGALGCLGAWTLYHLVQQGKTAVSFDRSTDRARLDLLLSPEQQAAITFVQGDLTDYASVLSMIEQHNITHIIHLGALQIPFCRADPVLGAQVNVVGTLNIFQAARTTGIPHLTYASSVAVYGQAQAYPPGLVAPDAAFDPQTLYGVYKVANEGTARIFWQDHQVSSITLRPYTVYGVGRDQGMTSEPTLAMRAAAAGQNFHISFGGVMQFHFASDVALQFIYAAENPLAGAFGFNLGTAPQSVETVARMIEEIAPNVSITVGDVRLPFPEAFVDAEMETYFQHMHVTPLHDGIAQTIAHFTRGIPA